MTQTDSMSKRPGSKLMKFALWLGGITVLVWVLLIFILTSGQPQAPKTPDAVSPAAPVVLKDLGDVQTISRAKDSLNLDLYVAFAPDDAGYVQVAASDSKWIGLAIQENVANADGAKTVSLTFQSTQTDRLGRESKAPYLALIFKTDDLRQANWSNLSAAETLDLAEKVSVQGAGVSGLTAWCAKNADQAPHFCSL